MPDALGIPVTSGDSRIGLTAVVLAAIVEELRRQVATIDSLRDPTFVQITVRFSGRGVRAVDVRFESSRLTNQDKRS